MVRGSLARVAAGAFARRRLVALVWLAVLLALVVAVAVSKPSLRNSFTVPGTNSQQALDVLNKDFPSETQPTALIVVYDSKGRLATTVGRNAINDSFDRIQRLHGVAHVTPPFNIGKYLPATISRSDKLAVGKVSYAVSYSDLGDATLTNLTRATSPVRKLGMRVYYGGPVVDYLAAESGIAKYAEELGLIVAAALLIVLFRSVVSALVPLVNALAGLAAGILALHVLANFFAVGSTAPDLAAMIGLGVGIDYGLFLTARYRQELARTPDRREAAAAAMASTGSAVLFSGLVVCLATAGLALAGIPYVTMLGLCAALAVLVMLTAALTLLPALWGLAGDRIRPRDLERANTVFARLSRHVSGHPLRYLTAGTALVVVIALPLLSIRFGFPSDAAAPPGSTEQRAYDLIATQLGPGANGPLIVVVQVPASVARAAQQDQSRLVAEGKRLWAALLRTPGVAHASVPIPNDRFTAVMSLVEPTTAPGSESTAALVERLRDATLPRALAHTAFESHAFVGGETATLVDLGDAIQARLPYAIAAVCVAAFLLLMLIFRSLAIPAKAVVMNLLSISAAYGVVVASFQWGWLVRLFGLGAPIDVVAFVPLLMFALLFGLSMDYELLLLTRIREEYDRTGDNRESVALGLARSGRVITSAALVMISVFLVFTLNANPAIKMLGVGMAAAVLIDATVVRLVLVPATMELLGPRNWWLPRWLDRLLPRIDVERAATTPATTTPATTAPATTLTADDDGADVDDGLFVTRARVTEPPAGDDRVPVPGGCNPPLD
jgi:RND superfamily putative drug exporter